MAHQHHDYDRDIDMRMVSGKLRSYVSRANDSFFNAILFFKRNIILVAAIIVIAAVLGYLLDQSKAVYEQKIIVTPNFGSVDHLYNSVTLLSEKLKENDNEYINSIGLGKFDMGDIKVEPVIEIYDFINDDDDELQKKIQVFKLIAESDNIEDVMEDMPTARNYDKHLITVYTSGTINNREGVDKLLAYLNNDAHYLKMKGEYIKNLEIEIEANDVTIKGIDNLLEDFAGGADNSGNLVYYDNNTNMEELLKMKNSLIRKQAKNRLNRINYNKVIKERSVVTNTKKKSLIAGRMKFVLPLLFIFIFSLIAIFRSYYKRQMNKRKIIAANE